MSAIGKLALVIGATILIINQKRQNNVIDQNTDSGQLQPNMPMDSSPLQNLWNDNWLSYAGGIMNGASWKINDYDLYGNAIAGTEQQYDIPTDLLARLLFQESRFRTDIINGTKKSPVGALGIAQFMPGTAAELGINPLDPFAAINGAGRYLSQMYHQFGGWDLALMAYNWGPGNVKKWLAGKAKEPAETIAYVSDISNDVDIGIV